jgi:Flp pilus assembly protein TadD
MRRRPGIISKRDSFWQEKETGHYKEAEAELRKAVALKPDYGEGWNYLGEFLKKQGKEQEAQEAFRKAQQYAR